VHLNPRVAGLLASHVPPGAAHGAVSLSHLVQPPGLWIMAVMAVGFLDVRRRGRSTIRITAATAASLAIAGVLDTTLPGWDRHPPVSPGAAIAALAVAVAFFAARWLDPIQTGIAVAALGLATAGLTLALAVAGQPFTALVAGASLGTAVAAGGLRLVFAVLAVLAAAVAGWAAGTVRAVAPQPRARQTVVDLARRLSGRDFLAPVTCLAAATAALAAAGLAAAALVTGLPGLLPAALLAGAGIGIATPLGFAAVAACTPPGRLGQTMGAAEVDRELGDAGGPILVAAAATATTLSGGLLALARLLAAAGAAIRRAGPPRQPPPAVHASDAPGPATGPLAGTGTAPG
jgi:Na+-transporting methylmalonyl-CoA/oxaloacetate decarboxylase gamma subunit